MKNIALRFMMFIKSVASILMHLLNCLKKYITKFIHRLVCFRHLLERMESLISNQVRTVLV